MNIPNMQLSDFVGFSGVLLVMALVEGIKLTFPKLKARWYPGISVTVGVIWNVLVSLAFQAPLFEAALLGIPIGLFACSLFTGGKLLEERSIRINGLK